MADIISGPGQGLPAPQALYPPLLWATPFTAPTNRFVLGAGQALAIPAGTWIVEGGDVTTIQWHDPVDRQWHNLVRSPAVPKDRERHWGTTIRSDGFNFRLANISGVATRALVDTPGSDYHHTTTHVVASQGNSRWRPIIGGALGTPTILEPGENYSIPPIVFVPHPPPPGICAVGHATLTNNQVTAITWDEPGAGYHRPPPILLLPDPFDPNLLEFHEHHFFDAIRNAKAVVELTGHGTLTGVLLELFGEPLDTAPTLTITGQGTGAAAEVLPAAGDWMAQEDDECTIQPASGN